MTRFPPFAAVVFALIAGAGSFAADDPAPPVKPTPKQLAELKQLLADYRVPVHPPGEKEMIIDRIFAIGPVGVNAFQAIVEKQLRPLVDKYRDHFYRQAQVLAATKLRNVAPSDGARLRETVLALRKSDALKKEELQKSADPAMKLLSSLLVIDREKVLEGQADLNKEREKLADLAQYWERCAEFQIDQMPDDKRPKEKPTFESYLQGEEELAAQLAMPMDPRFRTVLAANDRIAPQLDAEEVKAMLACNLTRTLLGLNPCVIDLKLCAAGRDHSHDMETLKFFDHASKVPGKKDPWERAKRFGTTAAGENIFRGKPDGQSANNAWFHSPDHFKNLLGEHTRIGVGRSGGYFTQMFGK